MEDLEMCKSSICNSISIIIWSNVQISSEWFHYLSTAAWSQGDPRKVIYPTDSRGQFCGQAGTPLEWVPSQYELYPCSMSVLEDPSHCRLSCVFLITIGITDTFETFICDTVEIRFLFYCSLSTGRSHFCSTSTSWNVPVLWCCWSSSVPPHRSGTVSTYLSCSLPRRSSFKQTH